MILCHYKMSQLLKYFAMSSLTATTGNERIVELDLMRGFALFGILIVNVQFFGIPIYKLLTDLHPFAGSVDIAGRTIVDILFFGKFITLFSFLFGLGFWIFSSRAREKGYKAGPLFFRRVMILGLLGAAHATLLWAGDILLPYAILGLFLMVFLNRSDKTVKVWMFLLPVFQVVLITLIVFLIQWGLSIPEARDEILASFEQAHTEMKALSALSVSVYQSTDWNAMLSLRLQELAFIYQGYIFSGAGFFYLMGIFLAGMHAGRAGWFTNVSEKLPLLHQRAPWLLLFGLICAFVGFYFNKQIVVLIPDWNQVFFVLLFIIGTPAMTASFVMLLISGYHKTKNNRFWDWLGATGRMSLTVYLTQSVIMTTIFLGYGFGMYHRIPVMMMLAMSVAVFALQMAGATWWMNRFRMGPIEWLWRAGTYGNLPAIKK